MDPMMQAKTMMAVWIHAKERDEVENATNTPKRRTPHDTDTTKSTRSIKTAVLADVLDHLHTLHNHPLHHTVPDLDLVHLPDERKHISILPSMITDEDVIGVTVGAGVDPMMMVVQIKNPSLQM
jgi:hypothetical protein